MSEKLHTLKSMLHFIQMSICNGPDGCENSLFVIEDIHDPSVVHGVVIQPKNTTGMHTTRDSVDMCIFELKHNHLYD